jgi:hypothetical protein
MPLLQSFGNCILEAKLKNRFKSILSISLVLIASIISFFITKRYAVYGAILPLAFTMVLNNIIINFYYRKIFGFKILLFIKQTFLKSVPVYLLLLFLYHFIIKSLNINSWIMLVVGILIYFCGYLLTSYLFLMNEYEKTIFLKKIKLV